MCRRFKSKEKVEQKREIVNVSPGLTDPSHKRLCTDGERAAECPYIHLISPSVCLTQSALTAGMPPSFICCNPPLIPLLFIYSSVTGCIERGRLGK